FCPPRTAAKAAAIRSAGLVRCVRTEGGVERAGHVLQSILAPASCGRALATETREAYSASRSLAAPHDARLRRPPAVPPRLARVRQGAAGAEGANAGVGEEAHGAPVGPRPRRRSGGSRRAGLGCGRGWFWRPQRQARRMPARLLLARRSGALAPGPLPRSWSA